MPIENPERVSALLNIVERVAASTPRFTHITAEAMAELNKLDVAIMQTRQAELRQPIAADPVEEATGKTPSQPVEADVTPETPVVHADETPTLERKI